MGVCSQSIRFFHCFLKENKYALPEQRWMLPEHTGMLLEHMLVGGCCWSIGGMLSEHWLPPITRFSCFHPDSDETDVIHSVPRLRRHHQLWLLKGSFRQWFNTCFGWKIIKPENGRNDPAKQSSELDIMIDYFNHFLNGGISQTLGPLGCIIIIITHIRSYHTHHTYTPSYYNICIYIYMTICQK